MESLALLVAVIFCAVLLCGPVSYLLATYHWNILATVIACAAIWLGVYWFASVSTSAKYLGLVSSVLGLLALLKVTDNFFFHK